MEYPRITPFQTHHRVVYQNPADESLTADQYAQALAYSLQQDQPGTRILVIDAQATASTDEDFIDALPLNDAEKTELRQLVALDEREAEESQTQGIDAREQESLAQRLNLARAYAQDTDVLILSEPLTHVSPEDEAAIYSLLEKRIKKHPLLSAKQKIFIVSSNAEVQERIRRDRNAAQ
ncbi:hypothetical protein [Rothia sp. ZJ1223]|uniref:hypothetical protein n=1 Tax=Rothia sp. ZJ1223 TaxID=2811098 RepID=UPI001956F15A|nr:hypothetical protein [Rothia sp. ZJ1223]MBM7050623.1 hypothetical protein [Rothia sp. ZJ1223]